MKYGNMRSSLGFSG